MESKPKKSFGLLSSISKGLRGLAGKSGRRPTEGTAPAKQRSLQPLPSLQEGEQQPQSEEACQLQATSTTSATAGPRTSIHASSARRPGSAPATPTASGIPSARLSAEQKRSSTTSASSMMRGDSASSTTISQATCPVALANMRVRQDLYTLGKALERMYGQVRSSSPLVAWQVEALHTRFQVMYKLARDVHRHEEESLYPLIRKHARLCEALQCQNTSLSVLWSSLRNAVYSLRHTLDASADAEVLREIMVAHAQLYAAVKAHWAEIDSKLLPVIYKECSSEELTVSDCCLLREPSHQDWAHFLSIHKDETSKKALLKHMGVSRITATLVLLRACKQYSKEVGPLFQDLQSGCPGAGRCKRSSSSGSGSFLAGVGFGV